MDEEYQTLSKFLAQKIQERDAYEKQLGAPLGDSDQDKFLQAVQGVESSFGNNTNHKVMEHGIHAGERAVGTYGLMPNTVRELANKISNPDTNLGKQLPYKTDFSDIKALSKLDGEGMSEEVANNPELETKLARLLQMDVGARSEGPEDAAFRWNQGHNIPKGKVTPERLENSDYVHKFNNIRKLLSGGVASIK